MNFHILIEFSKEFTVCRFKQKVDSRDLRLSVISEFDVLIVKYQLFMTIDPQGLPSVIVITSSIANFIHGL